MSKTAPFPGRVAESLRRSTVQVKSDSPEAGGLGSGVVLPDNQVLSNAHVADGKNITIECWDGNAVQASVLRSDPRRDLCLLRCLTRLTGATVTFGDSNALQPGTPVLAVGNPLGFIGAVSTGVVHSVGPIASRSQLLRQPWIRARLRLAPGSSGGPLADLAGNVIGINTMMISGGLALAVPSRIVHSFLKRTDLTLGVTIRQVQLTNGESALMILELESGGAAEAASLLPGDILVSGNGRKLESPDDLQQSMDESPAGRLYFVFRRGGQHQTRQVTVQLQRPGMNRAA